jgi:GDP-4-dehydro-6-deoxy-D-mannose reductase
MRNLITGVTGFAGGHLAEALLARGEQVAGVARRPDWPAAWRHLAGRVELRGCDAGDRAAVEALLREVMPERVYHLAGYPHVGRSFKEADAAWAGNLGTARALYEAVARWGGRPRVLFVGSGQVYGSADSPGQLFDEGAPLRPASPYAASKAAADLVSYQFARAPGLDIVRVRPFNHVGPAQSQGFVVADFCRQVAAIALGRAEPVLETGNLEPRRDFTDVRDVVRAYVLLAERGRAGEAYNVGSGQTLSMQEIVDRLLAVSGVSFEVRRRPDLVRTVDAAAIRADAGKLRRETGWAPALSLDQTLRDTLAYWRKSLAADQGPGTRDRGQGT